MGGTRETTSVFVEHHPVTASKRVTLCLLLAALLAAPPVHSTDVVDEVVGGVLNHDVRFAGGIESGADINMEVMFVSPLLPSSTASRFVHSLFRVQPAIGVELNTAGAASQAYADAVWTLPLVGSAVKWQDRNSAFVRIGGGGAVNNGSRNSYDSDRKSLGSHVLFHASGELGVRAWRQVDLSVYFDHSSNAGLCRSNDSINDFGIRLGWVR